MTITMGVASVPVTFTKDYAISDAAVQDILDWAKVAKNAEIQAQFNPPGVGFDPAFVPTNTQVWRVLQRGYLNSLRDVVKRHKQDAAAAAAVAGVTDIAIV